MGKLKRASDRKPRESAAHPLIMQADIPEAQRRRFRHEVAHVPSPGIEVVVRGEVKRTKAVRRVPHFEMLYRRRMFDRAVFAALEWYDARQSLAESGMVRSAIDFSGKGGGEASTHLPVNEAAMWARSDIDWARGFIQPQHLPAFDAVMSEGFSFREAARRQYAQRYVRLSVERARDRLRDDFMAASKAMSKGVASRVMTIETGRIRA